MIHAYDGRIFDPTNGREVVDDYDLQTETNDWYDDDLSRDKEVPVNSFDGLIHA
jgi:hypothetical protein